MSVYVSMSVSVSVCVYVCVYICVCIYVCVCVCVCRCLCFSVSLSLSTDRIHGGRHYGTGESFVFQLSPTVAVYPWVGVADSEKQGQSLANIKHIHCLLFSIYSICLLFSYV